MIGNKEILLGLFNLSKTDQKRFWQCFTCNNLDNCEYSDEECEDENQMYMFHDYVKKGGVNDKRRSKNPYKLFQ